jgi:hypothetical protein
VKESAAWKAVGKAIEEYMGNAENDWRLDEDRRYIGGLLFSGICYVMGHTIPDSLLRGRMTQRLQAHLVWWNGRRGPMAPQDVRYCHAYQGGTEWDARLLAVYWLMLEAKADGE